MIARIVVDGPPIHQCLSSDGLEAAAEQMLVRAFEQWPKGVSARFVITPGGFVRFSTRLALSGSPGWFSSPQDFAVAQQAAQQILHRILTAHVLDAAVGKVESLTIGIDLADPDGIQAELVAFVRCRDGCVLRWTGKSYPVGSQEKTLLQEVDLKSHRLTSDDERVLILGCHDLNMFSPRGRANQVSGGQRRQRCDAMRSLVEDFKPTVILHHPHGTDSPRIWSPAWRCLTESCKLSVKDWASGICFYRERGERRSTLAKVLAATRCGERPALELVFSTRGRHIAGPEVHCTQCC